MLYIHKRTSASLPSPDLLGNTFMIGIGVLFLLLFKSSGEPPQKKGRRLNY